MNGLFNSSFTCSFMYVLSCLFVRYELSVHNDQIFVKFTTTKTSCFINLHEIFKLSMSLEV
uniref:Uncharacterized protein n=1 Tax=Rhizophora mucronata TaxID=61149 RepID=A0A2P2M2M4_RHIMU